MKILFLDVDGVLNTPYTEARTPGGQIGIDDSKCNLVRRIIAETGCKIVISSTFRKYQASMDYLLPALDVGTAFIGVTPVLDMRTEGKHIWTTPGRAEEIKRWLNVNPRVTHYLVLDDDLDCDHLQPYVLFCHPMHGLTEAITLNAIRLLNEPR